VGEGLFRVRERDGDFGRRLGGLLLELELGVRVKGVRREEEGEEEGVGLIRPRNRADGDDRAGGGGGGGGCGVCAAGGCAGDPSSYTYS
jgi:hypothetical protein